ncbi:MAG: hypothetical protein IPK19_28575 [Chloroflexi bacterium]|nr:hypothetical protein [Chloroflexota bacterium]
MTPVPSYPRERGTLLTAWLVLMFFSNAWAIYRYVAIIVDWLQHNDVNWDRHGLAFSALIVLGVINVIAVFLLWRWRIAGLYVFIGVSLIVFVLNLILGIPLFTALVGLVGMAILFALVNPKRDMFY